MSIPTCLGCHGFIYQSGRLLILFLVFLSSSTQTVTIAIFWMISLYPGMLSLCFVTKCELWEPGIVHSAQTGSSFLSVIIYPSVCRINIYISFRVSPFLIMSTLLQPLTLKNLYFLTHDLFPPKSDRTLISSQNFNFVSFLVFRCNVVFVTIKLILIL